MVNVLMINKLFNPVVGGIEITITQLCEHIAKDPDFKVSVLAANEKRFSGSITYGWMGASIRKLFSLGILFSTPVTPGFPRTLKKSIKKNDVFHFHVPNPIGELSFWFNKIPPGKKVIVTVHADVAQTQRKIFAPVYNYVLKKLLDRADIITTSAPQNTKNFSVLKDYQHKSFSIPLAYDQSHVCAVSNKNKEAFKQKFGLTSTGKIVLFAGRLVYYKGLSYLIEAIKTNGNAQLVIIGEGNLRNELTTQVKKLGVMERIIFTGKLPDDLLAAAYSIADIFVLPSIKEAETFGIVQAEAMAYGLPVINTHLNTGVNFVSIHNETGITVPPCDSVALQDALYKILNNDELRGKFSENALKRSALFSPINMAAAFKELYMR